jgi:hypothetical protein
MLKKYSSEYQIYAGGYFLVCLDLEQKTSLINRLIYTLKKCGLQGGLRVGKPRIWDFLNWIKTSLYDGVLQN